MEGKVVAITGGAQGIGFEPAKMLVSRGARVSIGDIDKAELEKAEEYIKSIGKGGDAFFQRLDITNRQNVDDWIDNTVQWAGKLDAAGTFYSLRAELRNIKDGGSIVCISSVQGRLGFPTSAAYSAAKHGVIGLVRSAAKENGARNVRVNAVAPGAIDTRMVQLEHKNEIQTPIKRIGTPQEVAGLISYLLSDEAGFITGATYSIDGGWAC
ncbi:oxidoreductase [Phyllosticta citrichinensis]